MIHLFIIHTRPLPLLLSTVMGLQHAFAMVGGLITPPYVVAKFTIDGFPFSNVELQQYFIVAALITRCVFLSCYMIGYIISSMSNSTVDSAPRQWYLHFHQCVPVRDSTEQKYFWASSLPWKWFTQCYGHIFHVPPHLRDCHTFDEE